MRIIQFDNVWEMYRLRFIIEGRISWENFWALRDISFNVESGECLGIIGPNGAGKTTILKLLMGMLKPDRGNIQVSGRVSGLLELGAGFQPELTGAENINLTAGMFGLQKNEIAAMSKDITAFADIGKFIHVPVKCYSQGMFVRLGFSIAIHVNPDILLLDDTLAVGDGYYQRKCIKKICELKEQGKTIIFVSHDLHMVNRLCKKVLYLTDGRIIKDGPVDRIVTLYLQTIGEKEGVGCIEKGPLKIVFNNGNLFFSWKDKSLIANPGTHVCFLIGNQWHTSLQAEWDIKESGENRLFAVGSFYPLQLVICWNLMIEDDYSLKVDIEIISQEQVEIKESQVNFMFINEYTQWFTTLKHGDFPNISYASNSWMILLEEEVCRKNVGIRAEKDAADSFPPVVFEHGTHLPNKISIYNSDFIANCRVVQYKVIGLGSGLGDKKRFICFSGKLLFSVTDVDTYFNVSKDELMLQGGELKLIPEGGKIVLYYNGSNLTKTNHIATCIYACGKRYFSNEAHWSLEKESNNCVVMYGTWPGLACVQKWKIEVNKDASFSWNVSLQVKEEVDIDEQYAEFNYCEEYKYWLSEYGSGIFPDEFLQTDADMLQLCIPDGEIGVKSDNEIMPQIVIKFLRQANNFAKIFNSNFYSKTRLIRVYKIEPVANMKLSVGEYPCFHLETRIGSDKHASVAQQMGILESARLKFIFNKGKGQIYWRGEELTKKLGLYTSLRSDGKWHDSLSSAIWKNETKNDGAFGVSGKWLHLPITQYWEIRLREDRYLDFSVKIKIGQRVNVDRLQINLMLPETYLQWQTDAADGGFPPFRDDVNDDWDNIYSAAHTVRYIGVSGREVSDNHFPSIIFSPVSRDQGWFLSILNSDIYHRGRVLQYSNKNKLMLDPGEQICFNGIITIKE